MDKSGVWGPSLSKAPDFLALKMYRPAISGTSPLCLPLGEGALLLEWGQDITPDSNQRVMEAAAAIMASPFPGLQECVPAYASLAVFFDPLVVRSENPGQMPSDTVGKLMMEMLSAIEWGPEKFDESVLHTIPVIYDGPDLDEVATVHGLSREQVIDIHMAAVYNVYMMGFLPGFAYLGILDPQIATPRRASPRKKVPAGSVGIAGNQTGIYPLESPGGWQLIGRTEVGLFLPESDPPCLLRPGDRVQFVPR